MAVACLSVSRLCCLWTYIKEKSVSDGFITFNFKPVWEDSELSKYLSKNIKRGHERSQEMHEGTNLWRISIKSISVYER